MSVELKILVPYEEWMLLKKIAKNHENCKDRPIEDWERLKSIEKEHEKCKNYHNNTKVNGLTTEGAGSCVSPVDESGDKRLNAQTLVMPITHSSDEQNVDSNSGSFEKNVIVDKTIEIPSKSNPIKNLSNADIIQHIKEKYKVEASALLDNLSDHPTEFSYDPNGIVSLFGTIYPGSSIFEILPVTFYSIGRAEKEIVGVLKWLELLKKYGLLDFVKNNALLKNTSKHVLDNWYFLGPIS